MKLILACFLGISLASPIDAGPYLEKQEILLEHHNASMVLAIMFTSTDSIEYRIKRTVKTFGTDYSQSDCSSYALGRFDRPLAFSWFHGKTETNHVAGPYSPNLHGRAPPSL